MFLKLSIFFIVIGVAGIVGWLYAGWRRPDQCAYCGTPITDDGYVCPCVPRDMRDPVDDDELFYEWARGPGKDYPSHISMVSIVEGAVPQPMQQWDDGWDKAFYKWVEDRKTKRCHCVVCGKLADTLAELTCDRCGPPQRETRNYPFPAPPIPDELYTTDDLIRKYNLKIIQYTDPCEPEVNCTMYCALPPGKHFDHWPKSGGIDCAVKISVEKLREEGKS